MTLDWQLPDKWQEWAIEALGWTKQRTLQFSVYFRDRCLEKGIISQNWAATWRVWCNKQDGYDRERIGSVRRA